MSGREYAKNLIDRVPDTRMLYVITYLQEEVGEQEIPNAATLEAFEELDSGGGYHFTGSTEQLFAEILGE